MISIDKGKTFKFSASLYEKTQKLNIKQFNSI